MTRDRPASGAQDSTLEGEFPSELGSSSQGRASPLQVDNRVAVPYGGEIKIDTFPEIGNPGADRFEGNYAAAGYPVMRIYNKPLYDAGLADVPLNGIYANDGNYPFWYNNTESYARNINITGATTISTIWTVTFGEFAYTRPAGWRFDLQASANTTIPSGAITWQASVGSISPDYFTGLTTYQDVSPLFSIRNKEITANETPNMTVAAPPAPAFWWSYRTPNQRIKKVPFLANGDTTLTFNLTITVSDFGQTNASARLTHDMYKNFTRHANLNTIKSF